MLRYYVLVDYVAGETSLFMLLFLTFILSILGFVLTLHIIPESVRPIATHIVHSNLVFTHRMVSKTRDKFIEVARQLFARKGVENTTMNDIASASDKGRRTIYTYFKSKREIFNAVIESESEQILRRLSLIIARQASPADKFREFVQARFEAMHEVVARNGSLRAGFFRDVRKVDRARKLISRKEVAMLEEILREGVEQGVFQVDDLHRQAIVIDNALHGLDVAYIRDELFQDGISREQLVEDVAQVVLCGIMHR